jgi:C1A family cysteine protease
MSNSERSGFGGRPLKTLTAPPTPAPGIGVQPPAVAVQPDSVKRLSNLGLMDCEQLIAAAAVSKGISEELQKKLEMNGEQFKSLLETAAQGLPPGRVELLEATAPSNLGRGVKRPREAIRAAARLMAGAEAVSAVEAGVFPEAVDLTPYMPPIRNQGGRPTCAAFALTALNEYFRRWQGIEVDLSEQHLYYEVKLTDDDRTGCGTSQTEAVTALRDSGQCHESIWPYDPTLPCDNQGALPPTARSDGLNYRLTTFAVEERNVEAYKAQLAQARPVTLSVPTYDSWFLSPEVRRSGRITMQIGGESEEEGHAFVVVGYQNTQDSPGGGYFIVRSSWGLGWASESPYGAGYGTIPFQYITDDAWEAYSTRLDDGPVDRATTETRVRIKVGSNVEITIEDVAPDDNDPGRVSRVSRGRGPRPLRVSRAAPLGESED